MSKIPFRTAYGPRYVVSYDFARPSVTQQHMRDECDVNRILRRYQSTGVIEHVRSGQPRYDDYTAVSGAGDYHVALNVVLSAQDAFDALPAVIRRRFGNDPAMMVSFLADPSNYDEAVKLGLVQPDKAPRQAGTHNAGAPAEAPVGKPSDPAEALASGPHS